MSKERPVIEHLAELEHKRWANWQRRVHRLCGESRTIPAELWERWERQIATPYEELPEDEKESDREEARKTIALLNDIGAITLIG